MKISRTAASSPAASHLLPRHPVCAALGGTAPAGAAPGEGEACLAPTSGPSALRRTHSPILTPPHYASTRTSPGSRPAVGGGPAVRQAGELGTDPLLCREIEAGDDEGFLVRRLGEHHTPRIDDHRAAIPAQPLRCAAHL